MSRSIHRTRRDRARERRWRHPDDPGRRARHEGILHALARKRALKRQSAALRAAPERALDAPPRAPDSIPIRVADAGPHVHHHASPADVRAVLRALPAGTLTGIEAIELCLDKVSCAEWVREEEEEGAFEPDPFTGRPGVELVPGVWAAPILGRYQGWSGRIWILAHVHAPFSAGAEPLPGLALYLRLRELATLVHEVAHHDDEMLRRGRESDALTSARAAKGETFAMRAERRWVREIVVPYLERAYPDEVRAWEGWVATSAGIPLSLRALADDVTYGGLGYGDAYLNFLANVLSGRDARETRLELAEDLHLDFLFELSLAVVRALLAQRPDDLDARALEADVLEHLERMDEAQASVAAVLERDAAHARAWSVQLLILEARKAWRELAEAARRARRLSRADDALHHAAKEALAHVHLGDAAALAPCLADLRASGQRYQLGKAAWLACLMELRLGRHAELAAAAEPAAAPLPPLWRERVEAGRTLALLRLGRAAEGTRVRPATLAQFRAYGFPEWADELERARGGGRRARGG